MIAPSRAGAHHGMPEFNFPEDIYSGVLKGKQRYEALMGRLDTTTGHFNASSGAKTVQTILEENFNFLNHNLLNFYGHETERDRAGARVHFHLLMQVLALNHALFSTIKKDEALSASVDWHSLFEATREYGHKRIAEEEELQRNLPLIRKYLGTPYGFDFLKYMYEFEENPVPAVVQRSLDRVLLGPVRDMQGAVMVRGEDLRACREAMQLDSFLYSKEDLKRMMDMASQEREMPFQDCRKPCPPQDDFIPDVA